MKNLFQLMLLLVLITGTVKSQDTAKVGSVPAPPEVYTYVEQMPTFPGGENALMNYLSKNLKYPSYARETGIQGKVFITFVVNGEDGTLSDIKVLRGCGGGCDQEALRVVKAMPRWLPGKQNGKNVSVRFNLPIHFKLSDPEPLPKKDAKGVYYNAEVLPAFPSGEDGLMKYLADKISYPKSAKKKAIEGKVVVSFVVDEQGKVTDVKVKQSLDPDCDKEALRVVKKMPKWIPGKDGGKNVKVMFILPVKFKLK